MRFWEGQTQSLLGLIITNEDGMVQDAEPRSPLGKSDHVIIYFTLLCYIMDEDLDKETERFLYNNLGDYKKVNERKTRVCQLGSEDMKNLDLNGAWRVFANRLQEAMENNIPAL